MTVANGAPGVDPSIAAKLADLAAVTLTPDGDASDALDALELLAHRADEVARVVLERRQSRGNLLAEVDRLRRLALDDPRALEALRGRIQAARAALGAPNERVIASLGERLLQRLHRPPLEHVPTGLNTLDAATRGGLLLRRVHVIGGEPDAGKTALLVQLLLEAARRGYAVGIYAVDEPGEGIEDRIGQSMGLSLDDLEANVERAILWLVEAVRDLPHVLLIEQGEQGIETIEDAADALLAHAKRHGCRGAVLGIDSLQTADCRAFFGDRPPRMDRERLDAMTRTLKAIAKRGLGVIATSELGRASYDNKPNRKPPSPMAAFKGTGSIEYTMTVGMLLSRIAKGDHAGDVRLILPKNKRGEPAYRGVAIRLERDPDRCTYTDCGRLEQENEPQTAQTAPTPAVSEKLLERVRHMLRSHPEGVAGGSEGLAALVEGHRPSVRRAIKKLEATGEIVRMGSKLLHRDQPAPAAKPEPPNAAAVRERVLAFIRAELDAGRVVPSARAVVAGLREAGQGVNRGDVFDAVKALLAVGSLTKDDQDCLTLGAG